MSTSIGSTTQYAGSIQVQRMAQDLQKSMAEQLIPEPVRQTSGADSATFSSQALAALQAEEQTKPNLNC
ncbi:MAG TPA: hypothetical protein VHX44_16310 [Planctomycetota bacterium]|jgi:hypothetical protein|nr:hypothetical protein [Planctomycetota bacterium]